MTFGGLLIHTCTLQPRTRSGVDATGNPVEVDGTAVTGVPCRLQALSGNEGPRDDTVTATHRLFLDGGQTVNELTQVQTVKDRDGTTLLATGDVLYVDSVSDGRGVHHYEILLAEAK